MDALADLPQGDEAALGVRETIVFRQYRAFPSEALHHREGQAAFPLVPGALIGVEVYNHLVDCMDKKKRREGIGGGQFSLSWSGSVNSNRASERKP